MKKLINSVVSVVAGRGLTPELARLRDAPVDTPAPRWGR